MEHLQININMDKKCPECGHKGVLDCGVCMNCLSKCIQRKQMKTEIGKANFKRINSLFQKK